MKVYAYLITQTPLDMNVVKDKYLENSSTIILADGSEKRVNLKVKVRDLYASGKSKLIGDYYVYVLDEVKLPVDIKNWLDKKISEVPAGYLHIIFADNSQLFLIFNANITPSLITML